MSQKQYSGYVSQEILCPRCQRVPSISVKTGKAFTTHICYENCGKVYWTLNECPCCQYPVKKIFLTQPKLGELIKCQNCNAGFYLFNCPVKQCQSMFHKSQDSYLMGLDVTCQKCQQTFKEIVCQCGERKVFKSHHYIFEGQNHNTCEICHKPIIYTHCKSCFKPNYHHSALEVGQKYQCYHCQTQNWYIPCPICGRSTLNDNFGYCKNFKCDFCYQGFEFSSCCSCSLINYHLSKEPLPPKKDCKSFGCKKSYSVIGCQKCETQIEIENYNENEGREQNCPNCRAQLKFYLCKNCNKFNQKDSKCSNFNCPKPVAIKSFSREAEERKRKEEGEEKNQNLQKLNQNYKERQCKVCYNAESVMVNTSCLHVVLCQVCIDGVFVQEMKKPRNRNKDAKDVLIPCLVCNKEGKYEKAIRYSYQ